jgi:DNA-binding transcriptional LysR family regulator
MERPACRLRPALGELHQPVETLLVRRKAAAGIAVALAAGELDVVIRQPPSETRKCASSRDKSAQHGHGVLLRYRSKNCPVSGPAP